MKTQKDHIEYYTKQLEKVISSYGVGSDAAMSSMFKLKAITAGMPHENIFNYARTEMTRLHDMELAQCMSIED